MANKLCSRLESQDVEEERSVCSKILSLVEFLSGKNKTKPPAATTEFSALTAIIALAANQAMAAPQLNP